MMTLSKSLTVLSFFFFVGFSGNARAGETKIENILKGYLDIHQNLISQNLNNIKLEAGKLEESLSEKDGKKLKNELRGLAKVKNVKEARNKFKGLSSVLIEKYEGRLSTDHIIAYCPMAGAKWIQKKGKIKNPYMNEDMRECGTKI